jgi:flagellar hook-associated protein 3 FlgL
MRVSTANRYETAVDSLQRRQQDMVEAQTQMTSGKRINRPSDDPTGAARAERAFISQQRIQSDQRAVNASRNAMTLTESALGQAGDVLQNLRETLVATGNGSYTPAERASQATQLMQYRSQLMALANQGDANGGYLFGGQGASAIPFLDTAGGVVSATTGGQMQLSTREQLPVTADGAAIWLSARSGNGVFVSAAAAANTGTGWIDAGNVSDPAAVTGDSYQLVFAGSGAGSTYSVLKNGAATAQTGVPYVAGGAIIADGLAVHVKGAPADGDTFSLSPSSADLSPFTAIDRVVATLKNPQANPGQVAQAVNSGLRDVDAVMGRMQAARAEAGSALTRLDAIDGRNQDLNLWAKSVQADAEDVDMVQAISDFKNQQTGYQAALQSYASVQRMSLFDYIK